jgi:hypothetical protein
MVDVAPLSVAAGGGAFLFYLSLASIRVHCRIIDPEPMCPLSVDRFSLWIDLTASLIFTWSVHFSLLLQFQQGVTCEYDMRFLLLALMRCFFLLTGKESNPAIRVSPSLEHRVPGGRDVQRGRTTRPCVYHSATASKCFDK